MTKEDKTKRLKSKLKNTRAQLKRRDERIAKLEAQIAVMEAEAEKKTASHVTDQSLKSITREYQDIISRSSSSDTLSSSDAKQMQALEILSRLLKY
jgi:uncharacterized small protein (DUF1192 family)